MVVVVVILDIRLDSIDDRNINDVDKLNAVTIDIIKYINFEPIIVLVLVLIVVVVVIVIDVIISSSRNDSERASILSAL